MSKETFKPYGNIVEEIRMTKDRSGALIIIELEHHRIHTWDAYRFWDFREIPANSSNYIQIKTQEKWIHLIFDALKDEDKTIKVYVIENPTLTDWSVEIPIWNCNRNSSKESVIKLYNNPTNISWWDIIDFYFIPADKKEMPWWESINKEWVLKPETNYIIQIENTVNAVSNFLTKAYWYEV